MIDTALGKKKPLVDWEIIILAGSFLVLQFILPFKMLVTEIMIFALGAVAFNILLGFTGLLSFGQAALFGPGAYASGLLLIHFGWHPLITLLLSCLTGAFLAAIIGLMSIRKEGVYFVMLTMAFNGLVYFIIYQMKEITGGEDGLLNVPRPDLSLVPGIKLSIQSTFQFFWFVWIIFILSMIAIKRIIDSPLGHILVAVRENPTRTRTIGYNINHYKLLSFVMSGFFTGLAGGLYAMFLKMVPITVVEMWTSGDFIIIALVGGVGSLYGPVIGAVLVKILSEVLAELWARWLFILGLTFIVFVMFMRGGLWGMIMGIKDKMLFKKSNLEGQP